MDHDLLDNVIDTMAPELWVRRGAPPSMPRSHRHDDLEVNLVLAGRLDYLFGGEYVTVSKGEIALFWAATPHRLIDSRQDDSSDVCWMHIPLSTVLGWGLPDRQVSEILTTGPIIVPQSAGGQSLDARFESWRSELLNADTAAIALLETQALVRRVLRHHLLLTVESEQRVGPGPSDGMRSVTIMAQFAAKNFRNAISAADIAKAAHLNPHYAMTLFRETVGTTIGTYLTRCRMAEAQRLLITTTMTTAEVAHAAGFGSQSSFYDHFTRTRGTSPGAYRKAFRSGKSQGKAFEATEYMNRPVDTPSLKVHNSSVRGS